MSIKKASGLALAVAAAGLAGCMTQAETKPTNSAAASSELIHCYGVNKCGGHNDCKTANNSCAGQASCKGQGFVALTEKACADVGGEVGP